MGNGLKMAEPTNMIEKKHKIYPLVNVYIAIENGPVEIVDFPRYKMVDLSIVILVLLGWIWIGS